MKKNTEYVMSVEKADYKSNAVEFYAGGKCCLKLLYKEAALIAIEYGEGEKIYRPMIEDIEEETKGVLVIGNMSGELIKIDIGKTGRTAGEMLIKLAGYCPWAWLGNHEWLEKKSREAWHNLVVYHSINCL